MTTINHYTSNQSNSNSNESNNTSPKGSFTNPYTEEEFNAIPEKEWKGGYVEGMGYVLPYVEVIGNGTSNAYSDNFSYEFSHDYSNNYSANYSESYSTHDTNNNTSGKEDGKNNESNNTTENGVNGNSTPTSSSGTSKEARELLFFLNHPQTAVMIGPVTNWCPNISSTVAAFAKNLGLPCKFSKYSDMGDHQRGAADAINAMRHTLWQATISARYGTDTAKEAGDAHENNPNAELNAIEFRGTNAFTEADQVIDLLNNQIGRRIGKNANSTNIQELARLVLEEFHQNGLYTAERNNRYSYSIIRERLSDNDYNRAIQMLSTLDETGHVTTQNGGSSQ